VKISIEDIKGSQKLIKIEVDKARVDSVLADVYSSIQKKASIPGYRPGKAPIDLVKSNYNKSASEEAVNRLIWECYREAIQQKDIQPTGYPVVEDVDFSQDRPLKFAVKIDVRPEFRLKQYKDIKVKEKAYQVEDDDMEKALQQLQESSAEYKNISPRTIQKEDYLVCNYECFEDGKLVDKKDKLWLYINDKLQPKELLEALLGSELNSTKEVQVNYPDDYEYKELAGRKRTYKVTAREIKEKTLPKIDDELAKAAGNFSDLEQLKTAIRENILNSKKLESGRDLESQIYKFLLGAHDFDVPDSLVENQVARLLEEAKQRLIYQGYKKEDLDQQDSKLKESVRSQARENVRLFFIIDKIARQENIEVTPGEIEKKISDIASRTKEDIAAVRKKIQDSDILNSVKEQILHDKVVDFLVKSAKK
jgi:trigger factor